VICKKCGFQNNENSHFCQHCGASLAPAKTGGGRTVLYVAIGVVFLALVTLIVLLLRGSNSAQGVWHNEQLQQVLRFHDDGTVVIRSAYGDFEADYLLDKGGKRGVITLNGTAIPFALEGDSLVLTSGGEETSFLPGSMEIAVLTPSPAATASETATTVPEESPSSPDSSTPTPTLAPTSAPTPTPTPTHAPTPTAAATATATSAVTFGPFPSFSLGPFITLSPSVIKPDLSGLIKGDIIGKIVTQKVVGNWLYTGDNDYVLTFANTGDYTASYHGMGLAGTYTFKTLTGEGEMHYGSDTIPFTVSGDTLTWDDGTEFIRG